MQRVSCPLYLLGAGKSLLDIMGQQFFRLGNVNALAINASGVASIQRGSCGL